MERRYSYPYRQAPAAILTNTGRFTPKTMHKVSIDFQRYIFKTDKYDFSLKHRSLEPETKLKVYTSIIRGKIWNVQQLKNFYM